jgi:hypothetical protein
MVLSVDTIVPGGSVRRIQDAGLFVKPNRDGLDAGFF